MISDNIFLAILLGGILSISLTMGIAALMFKKSHGLDVKILGLLLICYCSFATENFLVVTGLIKEFPFLIRVNAPFCLFSGSLLYFHLKALLNPEFKFEWKDLLHLMPMFTYFGLLIPFYMKPDSEKIKLLYSSFEPVQMAAVFFGIIVVLCYFFAINRHVYKQQKILKNYTDTDFLHLNWASSVSKVHLFSWIGFVLVCVLDFFYSGYIQFAVNKAFMVHIIIVSSFMAVKAFLKIDALFALAEKHQIRELEIVNVKAIEKEMIKKQKVSLEDRLLIKGKIQKQFKENRPYLKTSLKLDHLAESMKLPAYMISEVINSEFDMNFHDLINTYRIEEAKKRLVNAENENLTILAIANDVGFNSKSVFNTAFKKYTGTTPSEFRRLSS